MVVEAVPVPISHRDTAIRIGDQDDVAILDADPIGDTAACGRHTSLEELRSASLIVPVRDLGSSADLTPTAAPLGLLIPLQAS